MIYILITALFCLVYNFLLFKHLGKWKFHITLILALIGASALGISIFCQMPSFLVPVMGLTLFIFMSSCILNHADEWKNSRHIHQLATLPARKLKRATGTFDLCRDDMQANFRELAAKDELATYEPDNQFLAWNDAQGLDIHIQLLPGEDWIGLLYCSDQELRDSEIKAACEKAGIPCPRKLLGTAPSGIITCRNGELAITPATQKKYFDELRLRPLAPRKEFADWLNDYFEED